MPASYTTLTLRTSDNALVANLVDGTNYALREGGWAPSVAPIRLTNLAIGCPYDDVDETITLDVLGSTTAIMLANLATLSQLLDQADRWARGENVSPVLLETQPQGSTQTSVLTTLVLGRAGDQALLALPTSFNDLLFAGEVSTVQLSFRRRGQWYGAEESDTSTAVDITTAAFTEVSFATSLSTPGPLAIDLDGVESTATQLYPGYLAVVKDSGSITRQNASGYTAPAAEWSTPNDSTYQAAGTTVKRYTVAAAGGLTAGTMTSPSVVGTGFTGMSELTILASVRVNQSAATFQLQADVQQSGGETIGDWVTLTGTDAGQTTLVRWISLGTFTGLGTLNNVLINVNCPARPASGTYTLDIDSVAIVADGRIMAVSQTTVGMGSGAASGFTFTIDPQPISGFAPMAKAVRTGNGATTLIPVTGDLWLTTTGATVAVGVFLSGGSYWRMLSGSGTTLSTVQVNARRRKAFLVPQ